MSHLKVAKKCHIFKNINFVHYYTNTYLYTVFLQEKCRGCSYQDNVVLHYVTFTQQMGQSYFEFPLSLQCLDTMIESMNLCIIYTLTSLTKWNSWAVFFRKAEEYTFYCPKNVDIFQIYIIYNCMIFVQVYKTILRSKQ